MKIITPSIALQNYTRKHIAYNLSKHDIGDQMLGRLKIRSFPLLVLLLPGLVWGCSLRDEPDQRETESEISEQQGVSPEESENGSPTVIQEGAVDVQGEQIETSPHPDELKIVYLKEGNVWLWMPDQGKAQLLQEGNGYDLRISQDGQIVAYLKRVDDFHAELWAINLENKTDRRLISVGDFDSFVSDVRDPNAVAILPYQFDWVPGTHSIAFNNQQIFHGPGVSLFDDLRLVNADSLAINTLLPPGKGGNFNYSPDGTKIVISTPTDISLINSDGTNQQYVLSYDQVTTYSEYRFYVDALWARDSTSLRLAIPPSDPMAEPVQETALWLIPADQTQAYQLGKVIAQPFFISKVTFSPDLLHIIFQRETGSPSENRVDLLIANSDGQGEWIYQSGISINFLGWSPDSNHFIFSHGENNIAQLGSLEVTAKPLTKSPAGILKVSWIDENYFIIVRENISTMDLVLSSRDGDEILIDSFTGAIPLYDFSFMLAPG